MNLALQLIGAGAANEYLTHASTDANPMDDLEETTAGALGITEDLDLDGAIGDEKLKLLFLFDPDDPIDPEVNNFEGSLEIAGRYYAVWPSLAANSACQLLLQLGPPPAGVVNPPATQNWIYTPTQEEYILGARRYIRWPEVPYPTDCP